MLWRFDSFVSDVFASRPSNHAFSPLCHIFDTSPYIYIYTHVYTYIYIYICTRIDSYYTDTTPCHTSTPHDNHRMHRVITALMLACVMHGSPHRGLPGFRSLKEGDYGQFDDWTPRTAILAGTDVVAMHCSKPPSWGTNEQEVHLLRLHQPPQEVLDKWNSR